MEERNRLLIVDDSKENIRVLIEILKRDYQLNATTDGFKAVELAKNWNPDVILLDVVMPEISGYDVCMQLKACEETKGIPIVFATAVSDPEEEIACIKVGALDYVTKPVDPKILAAKIKNFVQIKNDRTIMYSLLEGKKADIDEFACAILRGETNIRKSAILGAGVKRRLGYMKILVKALLSNIKFSDLLTGKTALAACASVPLCDVGKLSLPQDIANEPEANLTPEKFDIMKTHVALNDELKSEITKETGDMAETVLDVIKRHHERWDGTGYPDRLKGSEIPVCAQIMALVDQYDGLTHRSAQHEAAYHFEAVRIISAESGKGYNPELITEFLGIQDEFLASAQKLLEA